MGPKVFVNSKTANISNVFVSLDLLVRKEMILSFAQSLSKNLVDPYKMLHDNYIVR